MKKQSWIKGLLLLLALLLVLSMAACNNKGASGGDLPAGENPAPSNPDPDQTGGNGVEKTGAWATATYTADTELGTGSKTIFVKVTAEGQSITLTLHTDKANLRGALEEHGLVGGEEGPFGLYLETVIGIEAKYENGGYWWGIKKGGVNASTGVDGIEIADGDQYELLKTNQY